MWSQDQDQGVFWGWGFGFFFQDFGETRVRLGFLGLVGLRDFWDSMLEQLGFGIEGGSVGTNWADWGFIEVDLGYLGFDWGWKIGDQGFNGVRVLKKEIGQGFWGLCQGSIWLDRNRKGFGDCIRVRASSSRKIRLGRGCGGGRG